MDYSNGTNRSDRRLTELDVALNNNLMPHKYPVGSLVEINNPYFPGVRIWVVKQLDEPKSLTPRYRLSTHHNDYLVQEDSPIWDTYLSRTFVVDEKDLTIIKDHILP